MPMPSKGVYNFLRCFLEPKIFTIEDMNILDFNFTGGAVKKFLKSLKYYRFEDIANKKNSLSAGFRTRVPQYFIASFHGKDLLIDTQGFDYPRYTAIIIHYPF